MDNVLFCAACGAFRQLVPNEQQLITCENCDYRSDLKKLQNKLSNSVRQVPIERSKLLHRLYNKAAGNVQRRNDESEEAIIDEPCPKCAHPQLSFHTAQLRGVDEGQTVFYTCLNSKCAHKFTVNT